MCVTRNHGQTWVMVMGMVKSWVKCSTPSHMYSLELPKRHSLPPGSEEREGLGDAILPSGQYMKLLHHNYIDMNIVG